MEEKLLDEINRIYTEMCGRNPSEDEYEKLMNRLAKLCELRGNELKREVEVTKVDVELTRTKTELEKVKQGHRINPNDLISAATNLIGIGLILNHEKLNVISTKALGFVKKLRF